jgi:hypothetical protein
MRLSRATRNGFARDGRPMIVAEIQLLSDAAAATTAMMYAPLVGKRAMA